MDIPRFNRVWIAKECFLPLFKFATKELVLIGNIILIWMGHEQRKQIKMPQQPVAERGFKRITQK